MTTQQLTHLFKNCSDLLSYILERKHEAEAERRFPTVVRINPNELSEMQLFGLHVVWDTSVNQPVVEADTEAKATGVQP